MKSSPWYRHTLVFFFAESRAVLLSWVITLPTGYFLGEAPDIEEAGPGCGEGTRDSEIPAWATLFQAQRTLWGLSPAFLGFQRPFLSA